MRKARKRLIAVFTLIVITALCMTLSGCFARIREDGYFTYYRKEDKFGITYAYISQLTELGKQQKVLVIPEEIGGKKVRAITKQKIDMWDAGLYWESENLEKIFISKQISLDSELFYKCPGFQKLILISYTDAVAMLGSQYHSFKQKDKPLYVTKGLFEDYILHCSSVMEISEEEAINMVLSYEYAYSYVRERPANVSYFYNYATEINDGYYWIDDVEYGEKIEYVPQEPSRDGYDFGGWYKEAECINKWIFETDTLPEEQFDEEENIIYQETMLYAKWIKK